MESHIQHQRLRIRRVDIWLVGDRNYPVAKVSLPESLVADLTTLLAGVRELHPSADLRATVRGIWRLGCLAVRRNHRKRIPLWRRTSARLFDTDLPSRIPAGTFTAECREGHPFQ